MSDTSIAERLDELSITVVWTRDKIDGSDVATITEAEAGLLLTKLAAAEERERVLIAGVKEALSYRWLHGDDVTAILSRLLRSTPTEEP